MAILSKRFCTLFNLAFFTLCLSFYNPALHAAEEELAGRVVRVTGEVSAISNNGTRTLARGSEVFVGDTITTGPDGWAQIKLTDSAIVALKADTAFAITEYTFQSASGQPDRATMNLIQGGFRTITGSIGDLDKDAYSVETPFATIGIRGTDHEGTITPDGLYTGVWDGGTTITNESGSLDLGVNADYDYAFVPSPETPPAGLVDQPVELGNIPVELVTEDVADQDADADDDADTDTVNAPGGGNAAAANGDNGAGNNVAGAASGTSTQDRQLPPAAALATIRDEAIVGFTPGGASSDSSTGQGQGLALAVTINPNDSGDGIITCATNAQVCRDPDPEPRPEPQPEPRPEPQPEPRPEPQPEPRPEPQPEPRPEPQPEPRPEPQPEPRPEPQPEPRPEPKPEPQPEPKPEPQPEPKPEPRPEPKPEPAPEFEPAPEPTPTPALSTAEQVSLVRSAGIALISGGTRSQISGNASLDVNGAGTPLIASSTQVFRVENAVILNPTSGVDGFQVNWGGWRGTTQNPIKLQDRQNAAQFSLLTDASLLYFTAVPSTPTFTGTKTFTTGAQFLAIGGGTTSVKGVSGTFNINFDNATFSGDLDVNVCNITACTTATEKWDGTVSGQYSSGKIQNASVTGTIVPTVSQTTLLAATGGGIAQSATTTRDFTGAMNGVFTGTDSRGLVVNFNLAESGVANSYLSGLSLLKLKEPALNSAEVASLVNHGFAIIVSGANRGLIVGESPARTTLPSTSDPFSALLANSSVVLRSNNSPRISVHYVPSAGTFWGVWGNGEGSNSRLQTDRNDGSIFTPIDSYVVFASAPPLPRANWWTGTRSFKQVSYPVSVKPTAYHSAGYSVTSVTGGFSVNLDAGSVSNGHLHVGVDVSGTEQKWKIDGFSGTMSNGILAKTNVNGAVYTDTNLTTPATGTPAISGTINGLVTSFQSFLLGFDLTNGTDYLAGVNSFRSYQPAMSASDLNSLNRVGFGLLGPGPNKGLLFGQAPDFSSFNIRLIYSADPGFVLRPFSDTSIVSDLVPNVAGYPVTWGRWTGTTSIPVRVQTDLSDGAIFNTITSPVLMTSVLPTDITGLTGSGKFGATSHFLTNSDAGLVQSVLGGFNFDLGTGQISNGVLRLKVDASGSSNEWLSNTFSGTVSAKGVLSQMNISGRIKPWDAVNSQTDPTFSGKINGVVTGTGAKGLVLGFDLLEANSKYISGISLFEKIEPAMSAANLNALSRVGFGLLGPGPNKGLLFGQAPDLNSFTERLIYSADPGFVLRPTSNASLIVGNVAGYPVTWGRWTGTTSLPVKVQTDLSDGSVFNTITSPVLMTSVLPTDITGLTGSGKFGATSHFLADSDAGLVLPVLGGFNFDLGTGQISNGVLRLRIFDNVNHTEWLSNTFSGTVSAKGVLSQMNISGRIKPWDAVNSQTDPTFSGKINGVVTGTGAKGLVLGFDLLGANSKYITGITLFERTSGLPTFTIDDITALRSANRFGFLLIPNTPSIEGGTQRRVTLFGNVTQQVNAVDMIINNDPSSLLTLDETPIRVARSNGTTRVQNTADTNVGSLGLHWGRWDSNPQGSPATRIKLETNINDADKNVLLDSDAIFASFTPTPANRLTTLGSVKRTYLGSDSSTFSRIAPGNLISSSYLPVTELRSIFDVDLETGSLTSGGLVICVGGDRCFADSELVRGVKETWKVSYTGTFNKGVLTNVTLQSTQIADGTTNSRTATGDLVGALIGDGDTNDRVANSFVGGINLHETGTPTNYVNAAYLMPTGSYLTASELLALGTGTYGVFASSGPLNILSGGRARHIENPSTVLLADYSLMGISPLPDAFNDYPPGRLLRKGTATQGYLNDNVGGLGSKLVTWGRWDASSSNTIQRVLRGGGGDNITQNAFWFIATPSVNENATGQYRYAKLIDYQIGTGSGTFSGIVKSFGFSMVMTTGAITNGHLSLDAGTSPSTRKTWSVDFTGSALTAKRDLVGMSLTNGTIRDANKNLLSNVTVAGGISGMFVKSGEAMVAAFTLNNSNTAGPQENVSGTILVGQGVGWGAWNNPVGANWSTPTQAAVTDYFSTVSAVMPGANLIGKFNYKDNNKFLASARSIGTVTDVNASAEVNLGTGAIAGLLQVDVDNVDANADEVWKLNFAGTMTIAGREVTLGSITNAEVKFGPTGTFGAAATGSLGGVFTGANAEQFHIGFDLQQANNTGVYVNGLVTLDKGAEILPVP